MRVIFLFLEHFTFEHAEIKYNTLSMFFFLYVAGSLQNFTENNTVELFSENSSPILNGSSSNTMYVKFSKKVLSILS